MRFQVLYARVFQHYSYRRMLTFSQLLLIGVNLLDFVWVSRMNVYIGIPDAIFMLGDDLLAPVINRLNQMPFLIFAAKLCPPKVEAAERKRDLVESLCQTNGLVREQVRRCLSALAIA